MNKLNEMKQTYHLFDPKQGWLDEARALLTAAAKAAMADGSLPEKELPDFITEVPGDTKNGDVASNLAMVSARVFGMAPRKIAEAVTAHLPCLENSCWRKAEVAGPGFINLFLSDAAFGSVVLAAGCAGDDYGRTDFGKGQKVNVEFVSAKDVYKRQGPGLWNP